MHFKTLRLTGFKSFVETTEVPIPPGITGVVGPNGCGKSNLVEALRWVMGEGSARRLRGGEMDDVIFGGTADRPPRNLAEVVLVIDNTARDAPPSVNDVDELEISRRIERGSGSDYRINGRLVRARDVQLLFQDSNSGAGSPALVSQGRVATLISARPSERRLLLEEAAGIQGLHSRRHEAELRLRAADNNLVRLEDVLRAMETQLAGLKRQVRQTVRYRTLSEKIRKVDAAASFVRWRRVQDRLLAANDAFARQEGIVRERTEAVTVATRQHLEAAEQVPGLRDEAVTAAAAVQRLTMAGQALDDESRRVDEARTQTHGQLDQVDRDRERETGLARDAEEALGRLATERADIEAAQQREAGTREAAEQALAEASAGLDAVETAVARLTESIANEQAKRNEATARRERLSRRRQDLDRRLADASAQRDRLDAEIAAAPDVAALEQTVADAETELANARTAADGADQQRRGAEEAAAAAATGLRDVEAEQARLGAEADGLRAALAAAAKGDHPPVLSQIRVAPGYEAALGAAFGDALGASLDPSAPSRWMDRGARVDGVGTLPGAVEPLSRHVEAPPVLERRLAAIGVVGDVDTARTLAASLGPGQEMVTRDGALWRWDGLEVDAAAPTSAAVQLRQRNRLDELEAALASVGQRVEATRTARAEADRSLADARRTADDAAAEVRNRSASLDRGRSELATVIRADATRQSRRGALEETIASIESEAADTARELADVEATWADLPDIDALRAEAQARREELAGQRRLVAARQQSLDAVLSEIKHRQDRLLAIADESRQWRQRAQGSADRLAEIDRRRVEITDRLSALDRRPAEIETQRSALRDQLQDSERHQRAAADAATAAETVQREAEQALKQAESALAEAREGRVRADGEIAAARAASEAERDRIAERLSCQPEALERLAELDPNAPLPDAAPLEASLDKLTRERDGIGPVNLRAEAEAAELDNQVAGLVRERDDLIAAISRLRQGIGNLNREARERLLGSFDTVDQHFQALFARLFGGGRAQLKLIDSDDPLQAGLEILASPPGKRLQSLSLLSGGEQALTAIALLFAAFLTNPAPICVLDEVDAPLDDANVDRFCALLDELAESGATRFIIVTHHRMTMARVDRLYGVTMHERGVSQVVSVDLERAQLFGR